MVSVVLLFTTFRVRIEIVHLKRTSNITDPTTDCHIVEKVKGELTMEDVAQSNKGM